VSWELAAVLITLLIVAGVVTVVALRERQTTKTRAANAEKRARQAEERWEQASLVVLELKQRLSELEGRLEENEAPKR
jgi:TolA-binding protein